MEARTPWRGRERTAAICDTGRHVGFNDCVVALCPITRCEPPEARAPTRRPAGPPHSPSVGPTRDPSIGRPRECISLRAKYR